VGIDIRLVPFAEEHLEAFDRTLDDPDILRYTRIPVPPPPDFPRIWFEAYEQGRIDGTREAFAIVDATDGSYLGVAVAPNISREARTAELGYVVAPWARGRGVATEALRLITRWALDEIDMIRLELWISTSNEISKKVAERGGYTYEGTLRSMHFKQDIWEDGEIWSRLATDPEPTSQ
jgi:RimJ/RimL family protein N-acetyltransferase